MKYIVLLSTISLLGMLFSCNDDPVFDDIPQQKTINTKSIDADSIQNFSFE